MEALLGRALEYTLKYWLKSFSRDQLKLQGRTVQLSNLDINGEALHASMGLPPALSVTKAKVGKFEIILPYVSNVQVEPIIIQIDKLDLVLEENCDFDASSSPSSTQPTTSSKGSGYGFADKIADGMTVQVTTVNILLEMCGGARREGGAAWAPPLASLTIRNLLLYTTNESWQVVNLKETRDYSNNKKFIYVFKKLEWQSLSIDLLPHPDMFADANIARFQEGGSQRDDDGAKRVFFGGERFLEGIAGEAYITVQRTEQNSPLGLEVQVHVTEAVCPALSEPGLRALLRFLTGLYVCLNRGDVDLKSQQQCTEAAGLSLVSILVDHIFLCINDTEFRLELLMQSLLFSRATVSDGETTKTLTSMKIGGILLRDTFSRPPCALVQPTMRPLADDVVEIPDFAKNFCPPIYPLKDQQWQSSAGIPLMCLHSLQIKPSPLPPAFASETVIGCQPIMFYLQEESCLRIASFLADGIMAVNPGDILPDYSVNSMKFNLKELDVAIPLDLADLDNISAIMNYPAQFSGAKLHIENLEFLESPSLKVRRLNLEKDPGCFLLWHGQPIDASQKKWAAGASHLVLSLETLSSTLNGVSSSNESDTGVWRCLEFQDVSVEVAMVSADGSPLTVVPPPGGVVRVGVACQQFSSNTSVEQLFFVLDLYAYFGGVGDKIASVSNSRGVKTSETPGVRLTERVPCDTAVSLELKALQHRFLESSATDSEGMPLVQFVGEDLLVKVCHRTLGGAVAMSSTVRWQSVEVSCVETQGGPEHANDALLNPVENGHEVSANGCPHLRAVFWVHHELKYSSNGSVQVMPFLDVSLVHVIPLSEVDKECHNLNVSACIAGVRLGGGMNYAEALLHRFGVFGPDGGPGVGLSKGLENLSRGPLAKLFKTSPLIIGDSGEDGSARDGEEGGFLSLGVPDEVDICIELKDWLFALEGTQDMSESWSFNNYKDTGREEQSWHTTFQSFIVKATNGPKKELTGRRKLLEAGKYPVESVTVAVEGLQILKPQGQKAISSPLNGIGEVITTTPGGINLEACMALMENDVDNELATWIMENVKFSVKQPMEAVVSKDDLQHLTLLCKSEVDAMGRITAGVLKILKLEHSIGRSTLKQLSNLGTESFDKIFTPDKLSGANSPCSVDRARSSNRTNGSPFSPVESTIASLEEAILDSQAKCDTLISGLRDSGSSLQHLGDIRLLAEKLEGMKVLLMQLQNQI